MPPLLTLATISGSAPSSSRRAATPSRVSNLQQEVIVIMVLRLSHKAQRINILTSRPGEKNNKCYPPSSDTSTRWAEWCLSGIVH